MNSADPSANAAAVETSFQIISHAGLRVNCGGRELLCDPWLVGSCYWRSWWNYPPVDRSLVDSLRPDWIYLTHLHWDHFHGPSLRLFPRDTQMLVPYCRYDQMVRDLERMGFSNIVELKHGRTLQLAAGLSVTSYHMSPFVTDSLLVIEAGETTIMNANDAKFAGAPLRQILRRHPKVDFCLRSHSSANSRARWHVTDQPDAAADDNERYLRSFSWFMAAVAPRYAIPFASNHCLLHEEVFELNPLVQTPEAVRAYFETFARQDSLNTEVRVMVSGDRWNSTDGFSQVEATWFSARERHIEEYRQRVWPTLERQAESDYGAFVPIEEMQAFARRVSVNAPRMFKRPLRRKEVLIIGKSGDRTSRYAINLYRGTARVPNADEQFSMRLELASSILKSCIDNGLFSYVGVSKRAHYYVTAQERRSLQRFIDVITFQECHLLPLRRLASWRTVVALLPRWREAILYAVVLLHLRRGANLPSIEESLLRHAARADCAAGR